MTTTIPNGVNGHKMKGPGLHHKALIADQALRRPQSPIRSLFPAESLPGMLSFLAGKPNASTFPLDEITLRLKPDAEGSGKNQTSLTIKGSELETALQYGLTPGMPALVKWLTQWQSKMHHRKIVKEGDAIQGGHNPWTINVGHGSQDLLTKAFNTLLNPGDSCLVESPAYAGVLPQLVSLDARMIAVASDNEGMTATSLREILSSWSTSEATKTLRFPKFVYTTPTGANPSGTTASEERKRDVLQVVREYGILLLEDDPYMLLSFQGLGKGSPETRARPRTYWDLDQEGAEEWGTGWVMRFDSFSKILSAGIRMGYATGSTTILHYIEAETAVANLQPSGASQVITYKLLQHWGHDGLLRHGDNVASFYLKRRDNFEAKAKMILGSDPSKKQREVATWVRPVAGMFLWLKLKLPPTKESSVGDSNALISEKAKAKGILAVPGMSFLPEKGSSCYVRTSFSLIPEDDVEEGFKRLRSVVEEAWREQGLEMPA
ncbi:hypothetical protein CBS101457_002012 [Exobasidium rhododendri]|nr:hypothetical protein CBS101457_002012 [Exobasidium rhododendri]